MYFKNFEWTIEKLNALRADIDPRPQYQRGDAWDDRKRALLIDSILSSFDIPKIYFRHTKNIGPFDYEVADGQQRLIAIWKFLDGRLPLVGLSGDLASLNGTTYTDLDRAQQRQLLKYVLITTVVYDATPDQIRELFRRLQLGVRLNPAELRNSVASALGNEIRAMALTHPFFLNGAFSLARYKADDLIAHAFAVVIYNRDRDMKAPDLMQMYHDYSKNVSASYAKKVNEILNFMDQMQASEPGCIATKWGLVDLTGVLLTRKLNNLQASAIASVYLDWENERAAKSPHLESLAGARRGSRDKLLFDYITAFQKEGATKRNLNQRFGVLDKVIPS